MMQYSFFGTSIVCASLLCSPAWASVELDQDFYNPEEANFFGSLTGTLVDLTVAEYSNGNAQTFTVGKSGILDSVEIYVRSELGDDNEPLAEPTLLRILATENGVPIGGVDGSIVLAESSAVVSEGPHRLFDLRQQNLVVEVGDVFAIEAFGNTGQIGTAGLWAGVSRRGDDPYSFGADFGYFVVNELELEGLEIDELHAWTGATQPDRYVDHLFRTYVDTTPTGNNQQVATVPEPRSFGAYFWVLLVTFLRLRNCRPSSRNLMA